MGEVSAVLKLFFSISQQFIRLKVSCLLLFLSVTIHETVCWVHLMAVLKNVPAQ